MALSELRLARVKEQVPFRAIAELEAYAFEARAAIALAERCELGQALGRFSNANLLLEEFRPIRFPSEETSRALNDAGDDLQAEMVVALRKCGCR